MNDTRENKAGFFNYRVQKICSVFASTFATVFYREMSHYFDPLPPPSFDCRCFVMPADDVVTNFIWRQMDAVKNAVTTVLHHLLRDSGMGSSAINSTMDGMNSEEKIAFMKKEFSFDFNDEIDPRDSRGIFVRKEAIERRVEDVLPPSEYEKQLKSGNIKPGQTFTREPWVAKYNIPLFWEDRDYIERLI